MWIQYNGEGTRVDWEQVYSWAKEAENTYYVSTGKNITGTERILLQSAPRSFWRGNVDDLHMMRRFLSPMVSK